MLVLNGIDIVDVTEISRLLQDPNSHFLNRCFRPEEIKNFSNQNQAAEHYAGVFAAKEAVTKALGTGFGNGVSFSDIEIRYLQSGQPTVVLHSNADKAARAKGIDTWSVSISHTSRQAIASAIALVIRSP